MRRKDELRHTSLAGAHLAGGGGCGGVQQPNFFGKSLVKMIMVGLNDTLVGKITVIINS